MPQSRALAVVAHKGGVGKTTTAVNLAAGFAQAGYQTLLVDLDGQGSASLSLGVPRDELAPGASVPILNARSSLADVVRPTDVERLHIVPGDPELATADAALATRFGREMRLRKAIGPLRADYDFVVFDTPPGLGLLTVNALLAADKFLVPVVPQFLSMEAVVSLLDAVERLREEGAPVADLLGFALTLVDRRARATIETADEMRRVYKRKVMETEIPINIRLAEAPEFGLTVYDHAHSSTGADAYGRLTAEVLRRVGAKKPPRRDAPEEE
jgi:chromosome partitioning protein